MPSASALAMAWSLVVSAVWACVLVTLLYACLRSSPPPALLTTARDRLLAAMDDDPEAQKGHTSRMAGDVGPGPEEIVTGCAQMGEGCVQVGCGIKNTIPCTRGMRVPRQRGKACCIVAVLLASGLSLAAYEVPGSLPGTVAIGGHEPDVTAFAQVKKSVQETQKTVSAATASKASKGAPEKKTKDEPAKKPPKKISEALAAAKAEQKEGKTKPTPTLKPTKQKPKPCPEKCGQCKAGDTADGSGKDLLPRVGHAGTWCTAHCSYHNFCGDGDDYAGEDSVDCNGCSEGTDAASSDDNDDNELEEKEAGDPPGPKGSIMERCPACLRCKREATDTSGICMTYCSLHGWCGDTADHWQDGTYCKDCKDFLKKKQELLQGEAKAEAQAWDKLVEKTKHVPLPRDGIGGVIDNTPDEEKEQEEEENEEEEGEEEAGEEPVPDDSDAAAGYDEPSDGYDEPSDGSGDGFVPGTSPTPAPPSPPTKSKPKPKKAKKKNKKKTSAVHAALAAAATVGGFDPSKVPVVIFGGVRHQYLEKLLTSLDGHATDSDRLCVVSFNTIEEGPVLKQSFEVAMKPKRLQLKPIRVQPTGHGHGKSHAYVKHVWVETMKAVWKLLEPYDGDVIFIEDDLTVSADFFPVLEELSRLKVERGLQTFCMGGWSGHNMHAPKPHEFLRRASQGFPTMGYGFNRSLWEHMEAVSDHILEGHAGDWVMDDWSFAVHNALRDEHKRQEKTHKPEDRVLASFDLPQGMELIQPSLSRVWHVGQKSSIGADGDRVVSEHPPWHIHRDVIDDVAGGKTMHDFSLREELHNYHGHPCIHNADGSVQEWNTDGCLSELPPTTVNEGNTGGRRALGQSSAQPGVLTPLLTLLSSLLPGVVPADWRPTPA